MEIEKHYIVEFSPSQGQYHITSLKQSIDINFYQFTKGVYLDYILIGGPFADIGKAFTYLDKIKKEKKNG